MVRAIPVGKKRVVIYARFSSDMQREESIDAQIRACKEWAEREGYEVIAIYHDEAMTAKNDNRDDFQRMIADAFAGKFDIIVVHKFNRFARNKYDSVLYKKRLADVGIKVVSATQKIDDTPEGKMMEGFLEAIDEYYSANLGLEVTKGLKENAHNGRSTGGTAPLGFVYDSEGKLREDKGTSYIVRTIYNMYLDGFSMEGIANYLTVKGYRGRRGKEFVANSISKILKNERYTGTYLYTIGNEEFKTENNHDVIIDKDTFEKVQAMRKNRSHKPRLQSKHLYSLTGKITCGNCGGKYCGGGAKGYRNVRGIKKDIVYYVCPNKRYKRCDNSNVNKDKLERHICQHILQELLTDESIAKIADEFDRVLNEYKANQPTEAIDTLKKEKASLEQAQEKLLDLYLDPTSKMDKDTLNERMEKTKQRLAAVENEIKAHRVNESFTMTREDAVEYLTRFKETFDETNKAIVKGLIDAFVDRVVIYKKDIQITYKVDFNQRYEVEMQGDESSVEDGDVISTPLPHTDRFEKYGDNINYLLPEVRLAPLLEAGLLEPKYYTETVTKLDIKRVRV